MHHTNNSSEYCLYLLLFVKLLIPAYTVFTIMHNSSFKQQQLCLVVVDTNYGKQKLLLLEICVIILM